jgi:hypothetical protein
MSILQVLLQSLPEYPQLHDLQLVPFTRVPSNPEPQATVLLSWDLSMVFGVVLNHVEYVGVVVSNDSDHLVVVSSGEDALTAAADFVIAAAAAAVDDDDDSDDDDDDEVGVVGTFPFSDVGDVVVVKRVDVAVVSDASLSL